MRDKWAVHRRLLQMACRDAAGFVAGVRHEENRAAYSRYLAERIIDEVDALIRFGRYNDWPLGWWEDADPAADAMHNGKGEWA